MERRLGPGDPQRIGAYRLLARLGAGGMGQVFLARSDRGRTVAVKLVRPELAQQEEFRARFRQEVRAARQVGGYWTAPVLDADTEAAVPWVATGYVAGPSLQRVVGHDHGPLPERSVRILAAGLAGALKDIHAAGLIHRDLKPSNVLVTIDGPRVIDFGIARALETVTDGGLTRTGALVGSPGFMAPEQVRGDRVTTACDVFCLGSVIAYAATGALPFGGADSGVHALMYRIAEKEPDLEALPEGIADLVRACLKKDPAARPTVDQIVQRTGAEDTIADGRLRDPWLPSALVAQLGRHAVQLLEAENPEEPREPATPPDLTKGPTGPAGQAAGGPGPYGPSGAPEEVPGAPAAGLGAASAAASGAPGPHGASVSPGTPGAVGGSGGAGAVPGAPTAGVPGPYGTPAPYGTPGAPGAVGAPGGAGVVPGAPAAGVPGPHGAAASPGTPGAPGGAGAVSGASVGGAAAGVSGPRGAAASPGVSGPGAAGAAGGPGAVSGAPVDGSGAAASGVRGPHGASVPPGAPGATGVSGGAGAVPGPPVAGVPGPHGASVSPGAPGAAGVPGGPGVVPGAPAAGSGAVGGGSQGPGTAGSAGAQPYASPEHAPVSDASVPPPGQPGGGGHTPVNHLPTMIAGQVPPPGPAPASVPYGYPQQHPQPAAYGYPQQPGGWGAPPGNHPYGGLGQTPPYGPPSIGSTPPYGPSPLPDREPRRSGRSTAALVAVALVVALGAGGSVYALMRGGGDSDNKGGGAGPTPAVSVPTTHDATGPDGSDPSPAASQPESPSPADGVVPTGYLGSWTATIHNAYGANSRRLTITQGNVGDTVLTLVADGPTDSGGTYHCVFEARLAQRPSGGGPLEIGPSVVTTGQQSEGCNPGAATQVTLLPDGTLQRVNTGSGEKLAYTRQ
ncbi:protein kinase [Streptomyces sp. NPDC001312]|uniref:protein kinase domain-containing protein n=1 Tax=Streptomyces sp. NPDC001312 TaxID=3364561 RepID=UPI0036CE13C7